MKKKFKHRKICHCTCYKFQTLWQPGDIYEGDEDPGKHFSDDGEAPDGAPAQTPMDDIRSTDELINELKNKFNVTMTKARGRKAVWNKLRDFEEKAAKDAQTEHLAPEPDIKITAGRKKRPTKKE